MLPRERGRSRSRISRRRCHHLDPLETSDKKIHDVPLITSTSKSCMTQSSPSTRVKEAVPVTPSSQETSRSCSLYTSSTPSPRTPVRADARGDQHDNSPMTKMEYIKVKNNILLADNEDEETNYLTLLQAAERPHGPHYPQYRAHLEESLSVLDVSHDYSMVSHSMPLEQDLSDSHSNNQPFYYHADNPQSPSRTLRYETGNQTDEDSESDDDGPIDIHAQEKLTHDLHRRLARNYSGSHQGSPPQLLRLPPTKALSSSSETHDSPSLGQWADKSPPRPLEIIGLVSDARDASPAPSNTSSLSSVDPLAEAADDDVIRAKAVERLMTPPSAAANTTTAHNPASASSILPLFGVYSLFSTTLDSTTGTDADDDEEANRRYTLGISSRNEPRRKKGRSSARGGQLERWSRCIIWCLFGMGTLLLATAMAMAIGFVVTNRHGGGASDNDNALNMTISKEVDAQLENIPSPTSSPTTSAPVAWVVDTSMQPTRRKPALMRRPKTRKPLTKRSHNSRPSPLIRQPPAIHQLPTPEHN